MRDLDGDGAWVWAMSNVVWGIPSLGCDRLEAAHGRGHTGSIDVCIYIEYYGYLKAHHYGYGLFIKLLATRLILLCLSCMKKYLFSYFLVMCGLHYTLLISCFVCIVFVHLFDNFKKSSKLTGQMSNHYRQNIQNILKSICKQSILHNPIVQPLPTTITVTIINHHYPPLSHHETTKTNYS